MNAIRPITTTDDTVTLSRADYEALLEELEEARDRATLRQVEADLAAGLTEEIPLDMAVELADGANPVRTWRQYRGLTAGALAEQAGISKAYLSEIESGKKPGSVSVLSRIADILKLDMDDLVPRTAA
ncbi:helix-turn-helix domain-containing protein [Niveispirillum fermenti]|uniref:helix-turn-helix domain-containing protein n=1 Tax=Niveispirillum fermenti TaxID=1233113 RepID=UPI003A8A219D